MQTLLFKQTTDTDLTEGMSVAYPSSLGYSRGVIEQSYIDTDGCTLFIIEGAAFLSCELKLIVND